MFFKSIFGPGIILIPLCLFNVFNIHKMIGYTLNGWMTSQTRWTWIWVSSRNWWWTGKPGMLWSMGSQRVRHDWTDWHNINNGFPWWLKWQRICLQCRDLDSIPELGRRSPGEVNGYLLQYSCLGNLMNRGAWWATVHGLQPDTTERLSLSLFNINL